MIYKRLFAVLSLLLITLSISVSGSIAAESVKGKVTLTVSVPQDAGPARAWIPYPVSNEYQRIEDMSITGNFTESAIYSISGNEGLALYTDWEGASGEQTVTMRFTATSIRRHIKKLKDSKEPIPADVMKYLEPNRYIVTDGKVAKIAKDITRGKRTILSKARAIYDWMVENTYRDPTVKGCGLGIVEQVLAKRGGKCVDLSSVYVALARAAGVPAREVFGLRLGTKPHQDITGGYHCWAEFYLPGTGWVPVDPADVRKMMLVENLELTDRKTKEYIEYFWAGVDEYRIALTKSGRDIALNPAQSDGRLNYFMYPYVEVNGKGRDFLDPEDTGYTVSFKAK